MKYYIIAGEASGDLHAANLMQCIAKRDKSAHFRYWGGDKMAQYGQEQVKHYRDLAFMGFAEVLMNLRTIMKNLAFCKKDVISYQPDVLILVDYPGFNLRIAEFAHERGMKVFYYISPQIWAWKEGRVKKIRKVVDKMFVILPFEKAFYHKHDVEVDYVGNPLLDAIEQERIVSKKDTFRAEYDLDDRPVVALLPGSRRQEIAKMLHWMLMMSKKFPDYQFIVAAVPGLPASFYQRIIGGDTIKVVTNRTHDLLRHAQGALVTSGTATLETALLKVPQVVCYKGSFVSYWLARFLIKVKFISLVNLIADREVVRELIQHDLNEKNLTFELQRLMEDQRFRKRIFTDYEQLHVLLGGGGASEIAANKMLDYLQ